MVAVEPHELEGARGGPGLDVSDRPVPVSVLCARFGHLG